MVRVFFIRSETVVLCRKGSPAFRSNTCFANASKSARQTGITAAIGASLLTALFHRNHAIVRFSKTNELTGTINNLSLGSKIRFKVALKISVISNEMRNPPSSPRNSGIYTRYLSTVGMISFIINYLNYLKGITKVKF